MDLRALQSDPANFRRKLKIDVNGTPQPLARVLDPWQEEDFQALDPAWMAASGVDIVPKYTRAYLERSRGSSKTSDLATQLSYILFASKRKVIGVAAAADADQARLLRDAIDTLCRLNPWLSSILKINNLEVVNTRTGSKLTCMPSDVGSSYGLLCDFIVLDELTHWTDRGEGLFTSLFSAAAKRPQCVFVIISNAGFGKGESWQWRIREQARTNPSWYFHRLKQTPSWISPALLAEQKKLLPALSYSRLWENKWTSGSGDAFESASIDRAITLPGPQPPEDGWVYIAGLDIGIKHDASALVIIGLHVGQTIEEEQEEVLSDRVATLIDLGLLDEPQAHVKTTIVPGTQKIKLCQVDVWSPKKQKVSLDAIEQTIADYDSVYHLHTVAFDPWQAEYLAERLRKQGINTMPVVFQASNLQAMARSMLDSFGNSQIELYDHPQLIADLRRLRVEERNYGYRLTSPRLAEGGHGDCATSLTLAVFASSQSKLVLQNRSLEFIICD